MDTLIKTFKDNAELTTTTVELVKKSDISSAIKRQVENDDLVLSFFKKDIGIALDQFISHPHPKDLRKSNTCITDAVCGIASTGSVIINNDNGIESYSTMLTDKHIVILDADKICEKPRDIFQKFDLSTKSSISVITGPSATADMGSLVRGVHGPEKLHIIIIKNED